MSTSREAGRVPRCTDGKRLFGPVGARHQGPPLVHVPGIPCIVLLGFCTVKTFASKNTVSEFFRCYLGAYETENIRGVHIKCVAVSVQMCVFELGIVSVGWEQVWLGRRCSLKALRPGSARWVPSRCPLRWERDTAMLAALLLCPARHGCPALAVCTTAAIVWSSPQRGHSSPGPQVIGSQCPSLPVGSGKAAGFGFASLLLLRAVPSALLRARAGRSHVVG